MDLEQLKASLEAAGKTQEFEAVLALIEAEKNKGINESKRRNQENQSLRKYKQAVETLGFKEGDDLDSWSASIIEKTSGGNKDSLSMKALNNKISDLERMYENEKKARLNAETNAKNKAISAKLTTALNDKVYGADLLVQSLLNDNAVDLDGDNVVFVDGDDKVDFDTGIKNLLDKRKDIAKTTQVNGSGKPSSNKMPADLDSIIKSGDMSSIKANLNQIKQQYGIK